MSTIPAEYNRDTLSAKFKGIFCQISASLLDVLATTRELWWMNQEYVELR
jgi:hypothetical protein